MNYIKACCIGILMGISPLRSSANGTVFTFNDNFHSTESILVDSLPKGTRQDDKGKKQDDKDKKPEDKSKATPPKEEVKPDPKKGDIKPPDIKEVPKAKPKLRPGAVVDRVKVKRPPVRVGGPHKFIGGPLGL